MCDSISDETLQSFVVHVYVDVKLSHEFDNFGRHETLLLYFQDLKGNLMKGIYIMFPDNKMLIYMIRNQINYYTYNQYDGDMSKKIYPMFPYRTSSYLGNKAPISEPDEIKSIREQLSKFLQLNTLDEFMDIGNNTVHCVYTKPQFPHTTIIDHYNVGFTVSYEDDRHQEQMHLSLLTENNGNCNLYIDYSSVHSDSPITCNFNNIELPLGIDSMPATLLRLINETYAEDYVENINYIVDQQNQWANEIVASYKDFTELEHMDIVLPSVII